MTGVTRKGSHPNVTPHTLARGAENGMKSNFPVWNELCEDGFPSAKQVATCLGVTESTVGMYRSGKRGFTAWDKLLELDQPSEARAYAERMARGEPADLGPKIKAPEAQPEGIANEALTSTDSSETSEPPLLEAPNPNEERFRSPNAERWERGLAGWSFSLGTEEDRALLSLLEDINESISQGRRAGMRSDDCLGRSRNDILHHLEDLERRGRAELVGEETVRKLCDQLQLWHTQAFPGRGWFGKLSAWLTNLDTHPLYDVLNRVLGPQLAKTKAERVSK